MSIVKKHGRSFSQAAKAITNKYKRRLGNDLSKYDKLSMESMNRELEQLMQKQETAKAKQMQQVQNQFQEMPDQMAYGGSLPIMEGGGVFESPVDPKLLAPKTPYDAFAYDDPNYYTGGIPSYTQQAIPNLQPILNTGTKKFSTVANAPKDKSANWFNDIPTESKIGMGAQLAGTIGQGIISATSGKPKKMRYNAVKAPTPNLINNDEQINQATRSYRGAQNNLRYLSPSQYMAAMNDLAAREAATKAGIVEGTSNTNAGILNQYGWQKTALDQSNEQGRLGVDQYNENSRQDYVQNLGQTIGNIAGVVSGAARDEGARKMQNSMMRFQAQSNYGQVIGKRGYPIDTNKVGDMEYWNDIDGPHYRIKGVDVDIVTFKQRWNEYEKQKQEWSTTKDKK